MTCFGTVDDDIVLVSAGTEVLRVPAKLDDLIEGVMEDPRV